MFQLIGNDGLSQLAFAVACCCTAANAVIVSAMLFQSLSISRQWKIIDATLAGVGPRMWFVNVWWLASLTYYLFG